MSTASDNANECGNENPARHMTLTLPTARQRHRPAADAQWPRSRAKTPKHAVSGSSRRRELASGRHATDLEAVARVAHEVIRAWCDFNGDGPLPEWDQAPEWQRDSTIAAVRFCADHPTADDGAMHEQWLEEKRRTGWVYGPVKDPVRKRHPCMVPFESLPKGQQFKDRLLRTIVIAALHERQPSLGRTPG